MDEKENPRTERDLALAAAHQASEAVAELIRFSREGAWNSHPWHGDVEVVEKLCDAVKLAIGIMDGRGVADPDGNRNRLLGAVSNYIEGWA